MPLVARICPAVPVALFESRSSPVICSLEIVVDAKYERPETVSPVEDALASVV